VNTALVAVSLTITAVIMGGAYWWYRRTRPIHTFIGIDFGADSIQPRRIKNLFGPFRVKRNDGQLVYFPVPQGYANHRQDGKGTVFFGDLATGQLLKPRRDGELFEAVHGIFMEKAFADGRVEQIVASTKGHGITLQHILIAVGVVAALVIIVIYQFAKSGGIA
jgi:hypothetical protein